MAELLTTGTLTGAFSIGVVDWVSSNPIIAAILVALLALFFFFYLMLRRTVVGFREGLRGKERK